MTPHQSPSPPEGCIDTQVVENILLIGINRPAKRNGITPEMLCQLAKALTVLDDDPSLRIGVLHAFGPHFTAGMDLPALAEYQRRGEKPVPRDRGLVEPFDLPLDGYRRRKKTLVAAVKGICFTAGIELMLAADVVVAGSDCRFAQMEVGRGVMAASGATLRMAQRAGAGNALHVLLTGNEFDSGEALRFNFVQKVVTPGAELSEALSIARSIAQQAPLAVVATRRNVLKAIEDGPVAAALELLQVQQTLARTDDAVEGRQSFVEKRRPIFKGR
jgi:enoyl-CoA hydratase